MQDYHVFSFFTFFVTSTYQMQRQILQYSDQELQQLLHENPKRGFDRVFESYWKRLFSYAYQIYADDTICEDIVQEVFVSLWEKLENTTIINLEGYLFRAVKYKVFTHLRDLKFTPDHQDILDEIAMPSRTETNLDYNDFETLVHREIDRLPPKCRTVFMLSRFEEVSNAEIAEKLNISIRTVEKHISDAIKHLKSNLPVRELSLIITLMFQ